MDRKCVEFKYLFKGERHDRPGMTLLFSSADVTFEVPAIPGNPVERGESTFVSVYKSAKATNESWGKAKLRVQTLVRAEDTSAFEQLWTAADPSRCEALVQKVVDTVFGR